MKIILFTFHLILLSFRLSAQEKFDYPDVFQLEWIADAQISPDGNRIVYVRKYNDIMDDCSYSNLWIVNSDGSDNRPLTTGNHDDFEPKWTNDGKKLLYKSNRDGSTQLYLRWMDGSTETRLTNFKKAFGGFKLSPDGKWIAFTQFVEGTDKPLVTLPAAPKGAKWAEAPKYIDEIMYRADGPGYLKPGYGHLFVLSVDGGTPFQITTGDFRHGEDFCWSHDSKAIIFSANRNENRDMDPVNTDLYEVELKTKIVKILTSRKGPEGNPQVSPDGKWIACTGFDDKLQGHQTSALYVLNRDGSGMKPLAEKLDRDIENPTWSADGRGIYFQYDDRGDTWIAYTDLAGNVTKLANEVGGLSLGRPYSGGVFSVAKNGRFAFTHTTPDHPADLATSMKGGKLQRITNVNNDLFSIKKPGKVEEINYPSSFDKKNIQGWICYPPDFDPKKKYPLILEIHGGPFTNYGNRYAVEMQLYAAKGYVVLYTNPRGSTSYGGDFANLIHHNYPGQDYDDLMTGVDVVLAKGFVDPENLFVTGGSGGGLLTAWIVGHNNRFRAAVSAKPVVNWYSHVLYADGPAFFYKYWFPGKPWDFTEHYMKRSPISYLNQVKTPTMVMTGEQDYRTPISEIEQYYTALKLNGVETAMVRLQESTHSMDARPSNLIAKVAYTVGWFEKYRKK